MPAITPESKHVHFAGINFEEECKLSTARTEKIRKKKESIRMAEEQKELRLSGILAVINNVSHRHDLTTLCNSDTRVMDFVWDLTQGRGKKKDSTTLGRSLIRFAKKGHTSSSTLNRNQRECLEYLNVSQKFCRQFRRQIQAATVITSGSEEEPEDTPKDRLGRTRRQRTRGWALGAD